jgi:type II secretory pathway predicted ATPase ExeA
MVADGEYFRGAATAHRFHVRLNQTPMTTPGTDLRQLLERGGQAFSLHPQVTRYFPSASMENARKRITRSVYRGDGPGLVIGGAGSGKSLLLQVLAAQYHERFDVVLLACARICTRRALLQAILFELGLPYRQRDEGQLRLGLLDHLLSVERSLAGLLLLVDEAQSLSVPLLDELRVMTNLVRGGAPRVRLVMAGLPALEESFANPELESFSQRLAARCYLTPFSRQETNQFVRSQIAAAGANPERVFAADAWEPLFDATDGVPRLVNQLCDRALLMAEADDRPIIDRHVIQAAWADLQQLPTPWATTDRAPVPATSPAVEFGALTDGAVTTYEATLLEPTELDPDEDSEFEVMVAGRRPNNADAKVATKPTNPFVEEFDEEELVLDSFAAWDDMFHHGTPRVENRRDRNIAMLVQAAVEAQSMPADRTTLSNVARKQPEATETSVPEREATDRPRLRLANLADDTGPFRPALEPTDAGNVAWRPTAPSNDDPILIVEDDTAATKSPSAPVRRMAYQHLFSRLRIG